MVGVCAEPCGAGACRADSGSVSKLNVVTVKIAETFVRMTSDCAAAARPCQESTYAIRRSGKTMEERIRPLVERVWRYHQMKYQLVKADAIMVLCSHDTIVAERGARLFLEGWAPLIIFSGGLGAITKHLWLDPEANRFAQIAMECGVPEDRILVENRSTNTGENVQFTREMLTARGIDPASFILVQKPYMERRTCGVHKCGGESGEVTSRALSSTESSRDTRTSALRC